MDLKEIREILEFMEAHGLAELEYEDEKKRVRLKKHTADAPAVAHVLPSAAAAPAAPVVPGGGAPAESGHVITSPIVGTFYRSPTPEAEPFVEVGDPVEPDTVICIVEAMKVMNEVKAEVPGTVEKVLTENGKPVEYGQPLFVVAR
jgi:acetyl-CoA carboxylase biotin carboxyl carrier protein